MSEVLVEIQGETESCPLCEEKTMEVLILKDEINAIASQNSALSQMADSARQELYNQQKELLDSEKKLADFKQQNEELAKWVKEVSSSKVYRISYRIHELLKNPLRLFSIRKWIAGYSKEQKMKERFLQTNDIYDYLSLLNEIKKEYIILFSVKDTPGLALNERAASEIMALGFKTSLHGKHWQSYIGVLDAGKGDVYEMISRDTEAVSWSADVGGLHFNIESKSFKSGNESSIKIENIEYSVNGRGLNIVALRKASKTVVDSVCFDTHLESFDCIRN